MGLDITAYRHLEPAPEAELDADGLLVEWDGYFQPGHGLLWSEGQWPGRCPELQVGAVYKYAKTFDFRAGSYSGYNEFRSTLAKVAGYADADDYWKRAPEDAPFYPLINFADNEGTIGAATAARLARDFAKCQEAASLVDSDFFQELYRTWRKALQMAADGGALDFH